MLFVKYNVHFCSDTKAFLDLFLTRALGFWIQGKGHLHIQMGWQPMVTRLLLIRSDLEVNLCWSVMPPSLF